MVNAFRVGSRAVRLCATLSIAACGQAVGTSDAGTDTTAADAVASDTTSSDAQVSDTVVPPGSEITCGAAAVTYPRELSTCRTDADCVSAVHGVDCCGTRSYVGIARAMQSMFDTVEARCRAAVNFDACDCVPRPTLAQDGRTVSGPSAVSVACASNTCRTFVP